MNKKFNGDGIMEKVKINIEQNDLQYILNVLSERPYKEVSDLISDIVLQAQRQLNTEETEA